jgi:hypothetical protein
MGRWILKGFIVIITSQILIQIQRISYAQCSTAQQSFVRQVVFRQASAIEDHISINKFITTKLHVSINNRFQWNKLPSHGVNQEKMPFF